MNNDYSFKRYFIDEQKYKELIDFKVVPGDILISCSGVYLGKLSIVPEGAQPGIINQALLKVSLNTNMMRQIFFVYLFGSPQFKNKYFPSNRGGAIPNLPPMSEMKKIDFVLPPINIQNQFAIIVEKVEDIKFRYEQSLVELENLYGALSQKAFKGELDLSRIPLGRELQEIQDERQEEVTVPSEPVWPEHMKAALGNLNAFNLSATSLKAAQEEAVRFSKLDLPRLDAFRRATEQLASLHTPLHELQLMPGISEAIEQAQASLKPLNLEYMESINKTAELARSMVGNIPKIDLGWLEQQKDVLRNATEPFEAMRRAMASISWPSESLQELNRLQSETVRRLSSSIPDFNSWQKQGVDPDDVEFEDEDGAAKRLFTKKDVTDIFAYAIEPLSFDSLMSELCELETVDFAGYEIIKTSLFDLLAEKQLAQLFDNEMKLLLFSLVGEGPLE
nr:restriction endonuclease subunit S [Desulfobulbaceae bacterium]